MVEDAGLSNRFWSLISQAQGSSQVLSSLLTHQSADALITFNDKLQYAHAVLASAESECNLKAKFAMSERNLDNIFGYIILRGEDYYYEILEHPERMPCAASADSYLRGVASQAFELRHGKSIETYDGLPPMPII